MEDHKAKEILSGSHATIVAQKLVIAKGRKTGVLICLPVRNKYLRM